MSIKQDLHKGHVVHIPKHLRNQTIPTLTEIRDAGFMSDSLLAIPRLSRDKIIFFANLMKGFTDMFQISENGKYVTHNEIGVCPELAFEIKSVAKTLVYLINSASFRNGYEYFDFDKFEVDSKLRRKKRNKQ